MPSNYERRIDNLEAALLPERSARACILWDVADADVDAAVANWRVRNNWPDDGWHPIAVLRITWQASEPTGTGSE